MLKTHYLNTLTLLIILLLLLGAATTRASDVRDPQAPSHHYALTTAIDPAIEIPGDEHHFQDRGPNTCDMGVMSCSDCDNCTYGCDPGITPASTHHTRETSAVNLPPSDSTSHHTSTLKRPPRDRSLT